MTVSGNNNKLIRDWIRPLQKSLTNETENKFINTLGREKYFNDYLHESLKKLDNLNLSDEYLRIFYEFSKKYNEYNNCLLYTSPSPRDLWISRMPSSA